MVLFLVETGSKVTAGHGEIAIAEPDLAAEVEEARWEESHKTT